METMGAAIGVAVMEVEGAGEEGEKSFLAKDFFSFARLF